MVVFKYCMRTPYSIESVSYTHLASAADSGNIASVVIVRANHVPRLQRSELADLGALLGARFFVPTVVRI